jgi:hypothetical protein
LGSSFNKCPFLACTILMARLLRAIILPANEHPNGINLDKEEDEQLRLMLCSLDEVPFKSWVLQQRVDLGVALGKDAFQVLLVSALGDRNQETETNHICESGDYIGYTLEQTWVLHRHMNLLTLGVRSIELQTPSQSSFACLWHKGG